MRLAEVIGRFIGKVEVVLAGADEDLRDGESALAAGDPMGARAAAHRVLALAPNAPLALALLADACEAAHLDAELALTLEELARRAPSRAEVWVRLGRARASTEAPSADVREAFVRALGLAESGSEARRDALLALADLDLAQDEATRADLWLERAPNDHAPDIEVRRAEARLGRGDPAGAVKLLSAISSPLTDGRAALVLGQALAHLGDPAAFVPLVRAMVLDTPSASDALSSALSHVPSDAQTRTRIRSVVDAKGEQGIPRWRAAFARAEGDRSAAKDALCEAVNAGDRASIGPLLDAALEDRDEASLRIALEGLSVAADERSPTPRRARADDSLEEDARRWVRARSQDGRDALDTLQSVANARVVPWAMDQVTAIARSWIPTTGVPAAWGDVLARLDAHAHAMRDYALASRVGELSAERSRPVRLAIVGEFNAGKSTLINALLGSDVAPTGVLPTTATLHHLRWGPDPLAKIVFASDSKLPERMVALAELRAALKTINPHAVARVEIRMPLPTLVRVEILDTPGFNAPDPRHAEVARSAFEEADMALWLLDATQPMKQSELAILEEAQRARLPIQMLVNKADRLTALELAQVMTEVDVALAQTHIVSWSAPFAFSAKRALAGRLGDTHALEESGWAAAERLIEEGIVARSDELKERSLRRRAAAIVAELVQLWAARAAAEEKEAAQRGALLRRTALAAARIESDADALAERLAESLRPQAEAWSRDVDVIFVGRDRQAADRDAVLIRYRVDRAVEALAPALARSLSSLAVGAELPPPEMDPICRAIVRAAVACMPADRSALLLALGKAAISGLVEHLFARSAGPAPPTVAGGTLRELDAFALALGDPVPGPG